MLHGRKIEFKCFICFKKVSLHILSQAALNSMMIYKNLHGNSQKKLTYVDYLRNLVCEGLERWFPKA